MRLRRPRQFQRVRRTGQLYHHSLVSLTAAPNRRHQSRCGFVVGKHIGSAVQRNRAKRRLREAVRLIYATIAPGFDLIFVVRSATMTHIPFPTIQAAVELLLRRAGLLLDPLSSTDIPQHHPKP